MKTLFSIVMLINFTFLMAQEKPLDTIYANENKNVALFFPSPIRQAVTGAENFVFSYNRDKEQYFGLLQAQPGYESNLLAITNDGRVYAYILKYRDQLEELNRFVNESESIGLEKPSKPKNKTPKAKGADYKNRVTFFEKYSQFLLSRNLKTIASKKEQGIKFSVKEIAYQFSEVYLVLEIENNSEIDFEMDYLDVYIVNTSKRNKTSYQGLKQLIVFKYDFPAIIKSEDTQCFVYVLPKFVLGKSDRLELQLSENHGNRKLQLKL